MSQWYFAVDGRQAGPMDEAAALQFARANRDAHCWRPGFADWQLARETAELRVDGEGPPMMRRPPEVMGRSTSADEIDYTIHGQEMQYVEIELDPGESAIAEAGSMMYKDASIDMTTIFGDGSNQEGAGFLDKLIGAGKRVLTGESLFTTVFTHSGHGRAKVAFAAPFPGHILAIHLAETGGCLICQKDSFLAAAKGVSIGIHFQRKILTGLFGGEGFIMQRLDGAGWVFVHMGGTLHKRELAPGEVLHVDTGCLAAVTESVDYDIVQAGGIKSVVFGGEGLFFARLTGPGTVWMQSLPFSRLAGRMLASAPRRGGSQGEGSVLGGFGDLFGDSR